MAVSATITCDTCHEKKTVMHSPSDIRPPTTCNECKEDSKAREKREHLEHLKTLPIEERLERIEEFVYDHKRAYHPRRAWRG